MDVRVCGSYRREQLTSNDIDVIITHPNIITLEQTKKGLMNDLLTGKVRVKV